MSTLIVFVSFLCSGISLWLCDWHAKVCKSVLQTLPFRVELFLSFLSSDLMCVWTAMTKYHELNQCPPNIYKPPLKTQCPPLPNTASLSSRIELRALGKIAEGEELTVSYVDFLQLSANRQHILKQQYHFDCTCQHCTGHIKDDLMMAAKETEENKVRVLTVGPMTNEIQDPIPVPYTFEKHWIGFDCVGIHSLTKLGKSDLRSNLSKLDMLCFLPLP